MANKKYWLIELWNSTELMEQRKIPIGQITVSQFKNLLITLTAKHTLGDDEIINYFLRKNTKRYSDLLKVQTLQGEGPASFSCGENPFFTARTIEE